MPEYGAVGHGKLKTNFMFRKVASLGVDNANELKTIVLFTNPSVWLCERDKVTEYAQTKFYETIDYTLAITSN